MLVRTEEEAWKGRHSPRPQRPRTPGGGGLVLFFWGDNKCKLIYISWICFPFLQILRFPSSFLHSPSKQNRTYQSIATPPGTFFEHYWLQLPNTRATIRVSPSCCFIWQLLLRKVSGTLSTRSKLGPCHWSIHLPLLSFRRSSFFRTLSPAPSASGPQKHRTIFLRVTLAYLCFPGTFYNRNRGVSAKVDQNFCEKFTNRM